jgi:O-antigen chain-terminating methyltransferase
MRSDVKNNDNLLDSAAKVFRGRMSSGSRFQALLDAGSQAPAAAIVTHVAEGGEISLPSTLRLSRSTESTAPQIGDMPPGPPTMRGRIGAMLVQAVRRGLFWYTGQIRAFQGMVAEAAREQAGVLQDLESRRQRQQALTRDALDRLDARFDTLLDTLEQDRALSAGQLQAVERERAASEDRLDARLDTLLDTLEQDRALSAGQLQALERERAAGEDRLDVRLNDLTQELSSSNSRIAAQQNHLQAQENHLQAQENHLQAQENRLQAQENHLQELQKLHEESRNEFSRTLESGSRTALESVAALGSRLGQIEETMAAISRAIETEGREVRRQIQKERTRLVQQEFRLNLLLKEARTKSTAGLQTVAEEMRHADDAFAIDHARAFRGERAEIKSRLVVYAPYVREAFAATGGAAALDLGCGRGEWLELMGEMKVPAKGIDWNRALVESCRERGLDAGQGEIPRILTTIPDESLSVVTAFHVLEHIAFPDLLEVIDQAVRILKPGGIAIFETPNPGNSFVSSNTFYLDPTHRHPIPSGLLAFVVEARGLCEPKVLPLSPYPDHLHLPASECPAVQFINDHFYGPQDYGIVGFKAN